jgi:signal transduction histidine kinase
MKPSSADEMLKLRTEERALKTEELKQSSNSLLASIDALKLRTEELANAHADLFESNHQLASLNKELAATNRKFAQMIDELSAANKELASVNEKLALANEQIKAHENMTKDLINIASHEIRTPAQSILGYSELLQILFEEEQGDNQAKRGEDSSNRKELDNQKKKALEAIDRNADRLQKLVKDILDITKIESNTLRLDKERFSLNDKIRGAIEDVVTKKDASSDKNKNIKFEPKEGEDIFIDADKSRIYQVISNLLKNAIKFVKEDGTITITVDLGTMKGKGGEEVVVVKVKDTGTGIDASILPRLFTKFATISSQGIGLGLYISKNIIEAHGGRIWAENNPDGKGATFAFSLPFQTN